LTGKPSGGAILRFFVTMTGPFGFGGATGAGVGVAAGWGALGGLAGLAFWGSACSFLMPIANGTGFYALNSTGQHSASRSRRRLVAARNEVALLGLSSAFDEDTITIMRG
jgi:hypothetical protein